MFDVIPEEISQLNDTDLRELVGRLCEAELLSRGCSPGAATWGGNQTAADGGLDVRVALPPTTAIDGFIPRRSVGFQVKKPDMPRAEIIAEMRPPPARLIRPAIQELADEAGAYVIVSSSGSTTDAALQTRERALREALTGVAGADQLHTAFYDRTRLATWVRCHPGIIAWVKTRVGKAISGWFPYGAWTGGAEGDGGEYLLDDKLRLHLGKRVDERALSVIDAIDELRDELTHPRKVVRLVGLSGVGKTRLVQALFDSRIGSRPIHPSLAIYANLSDDPNPQPTGLISHLIANRQRAVLVVDNCPPDLHRRLAELCQAQASNVSVVTVEYDVRSDQPEGTQVVTLDAASPELVERLLRRRYPHLSQVDAHTIADFSGGNSRIAVALAETVERADAITGLSNEDLFQRLFRQRQEADHGLHRAAQVCSLVYSFQGEILDDKYAELPRLALLAGQSTVEMYSHVRELLRRNLMQQRGPWRAVLPHAIANRLAARAIEDIPYELIKQQLVDKTPRLAISFSRRLSFLPDHPQAVRIVEAWLEPRGLVGDLGTLSSELRAVFNNIAPVLPKAALAAIIRANHANPGGAALILGQQYCLILRSIAYDADLFAQSAALIAKAAIQGRKSTERQRASEIFSSLFTVYLSGTHAKLEQRLAVIEGLLRSNEMPAKELGVAALKATLQTRHFSSQYQFQFGARSRDYGHHPQGREELAVWYRTAIEFLERIAWTEETLKAQMRNVLAERFRSLWASGLILTELEQVCRRFAKEGFWRDGWVACLKTLRYELDKRWEAGISRLSALATDLGPSTAYERAQAIVLGEKLGGFDLEEVGAKIDWDTSAERLEAEAKNLGAEIANANATFASLLPQILRGGSRVWSFGRGLAAASTDTQATWTMIVEELDSIPSEQQNIQVLGGFLAEVAGHDRNLANNLLKLAFLTPPLQRFLPQLHSAVGLDEWGAAQLKHALTTKITPVEAYHNLAFGPVTANLNGDALAPLILSIADRTNGIAVAIDILSTRFHHDKSSKRIPEPILLEAGRELMRRISFGAWSEHIDYDLAGIAQVCLSGRQHGSIAATAVSRLARAVAARETYAYDNRELLKTLLKMHPSSTLDALFAGEVEDEDEFANVFDRFGQPGENAADGISCEALVEWCSIDSKRRFPLAASIITFSNQRDGDACPVWSAQAKALLSGAPDRQSVLMTIVQRFTPMSWSGSRAALIAKNAQLLDDLSWLSSPELAAFAEGMKAGLQDEIARERQWEAQRDRARDERFEQTEW